MLRLLAELAQLALAVIALAAAGLYGAGMAWLIFRASRRG